jgi:hypothetical protein
LVKPPFDGGFFVLYTPQVLAVLVRDRHAAIAGARAAGSRIRLRRRLAAVAYAIGAGITTLGAVVDEPGTVKA